MSRSRLMNRSTDGLGVILWNEIQNLTVRTTSSSSSTISVGGSGSPASLGTHCTCNNNFPTSHGIAIAVLVYCMTADASNELRSSLTSIPVSLRSSEGDKSNMDLELGREAFHSYVYEEPAEEAGAGKPLGAEFGTGRKDQAEDGSLYRSRRELDEVIA